MKNEVKEAKALDEVLINLRGYVSKLPKNKKVIIVFSGGLDSVSVIGRCLIDFGLEVFPVSFHRGQSNINAELKAIKYFDRYFSTRFPKQYHRVKILKVDIPLKELKKKYS